MFYYNSVKMRYQTFEIYTFTSAYINFIYSINKMGSAGLTKSKSLERFFPNFRPEDWEVAQSNQRDGNSRYGQLTTLRNKITCNEIDKYQLSFSSDREQRIYEECFMQRLREEFLVNAFHYQPLRTSGICSSVKGAVVYIQHIPVRLCDFDDIPLHESLYIIKCALLGFEKLYNESGYFQVMEEHIGVDKLGRIKVWLNADLSKNYPFCFQEDLHQTKDSERVMVQEIINLIQKSTNFQEPYLDQYQVPMPLTPPLSQFMRKHGFAHASFRQAVEAINQYCLKYKIELPKKCGSIIRIFRQQIVGDNQGDDNDDFDGNGQTCDEQYLNRLEVEQEQAGNQYNSAINTQANQREGENNMENSRAKNEIKHNIASGARPVSGQENVSEVQHMSYKQYQPISIYKPNHMKNSGMSASVGSETSRNNRERIKLKSHRSSISGSRPRQTNSNKNLPELNFVQNHNRSSQISQKSNASKHSRHSKNGNFNNEAPLMPGKSINGPDLYGNKSSQSSNFYKQIGDDFNRICSNQSSNSNSNSARSSQQVPHVYQPYGGQHYGNQQYITSQYNPQQILQVNPQQTVQANVQSGIELRQEFGVNPKQGALSNRSNNSHNNSSRNSHSSPNTYNNQNSQNNINNHNSRISNPDFQAAPVCRQQLQNSRAERALTGSSASSRSQSHIVRNGNIPKISFSYNSRRDNIQYNSQKQKPNIQAISQNIIDNAQMNGQKKRKNNVEVEQEFRKDLEEQLKKRRGGSINRISQQAFKKKSLDVPEKIIEAKQEDEIDPQIMQDLLRMESKGQVC